MEWWILAFLVGHLAALFSPILLPLNLLLTIACFVLALTILLINTLTKKHKRITYIVRLINGAITGAVYLMIMANLHFTNNFVANEKQGYVIKGTVSSVVIPGQQSASQTVSLTLNQIDGLPIMQPWYLPATRIRLNWFKPSLLLQQGDELLITVNVNKPHGYQNRFGFDYNKWVFAKGYIATGNIKKVHSYSRYSPSKSFSLALNTQQQSSNKLVAATSGLASQGIILAVGLGNRSLITSSEFELYNHMGISHLLAISGLHIGIIFLVIKLLIKLVLRISHLHMNYVMLQLLVVTLLWSYIALISFPVSASRAALFVSLWVLLNVCFNNLNKIKMLSVVALFSLLLDPFAILTAAWWLTFSAVFGIILFIQKYPLAQKTTDVSSEQLKVKVIRRFNSLMDKIIYVIKFQIFITIWMMPVVMFFFGGASLSGVLTNLIAIPLFSLLLVPCIFIGTIFTMLNFTILDEEVGRYLFTIADTVITQLIDIFSHYSVFHYWIDIAYGIWFWLLLVILIVLVLPSYYSLVIYPSNNLSQSKLIKFYGLSILPSTFLLLPILLSFLSWQTFDTKSSLTPRLKMMVLDVGQGTSVIFQQGRSALLYDLGPLYPSGFNATQAAVKPMLVGLGITDISHIIISHNDSDHIGDISVLGDDLWAEATLFDCLSSVKSFSWLNVNVEILWPNHNIYNDVTQLSKNDRSCVVKVTDTRTKYSVLLTGDITAKIERRLLAMDKKNLIDLHSNAIISAHHGSKYSSITGFINAVSPTEVFHSAGVNNRFGFPTQEVISRFESLNQLNSHRQTQQYSTNDIGMIKVVFNNNIVNDNKGDMVIGYLNHWQPFWKKQNPFIFTAEIR